MDTRHIALTTPGGFEPRRASDGEEFRADAPLLQLAQQIVEANAVASDHDEIGQLQILAE